jgi:hypothetical protein
VRPRAREEMYDTAGITSKGNSRLILKRGA